MLSSLTETFMAPTGPKKDAAKRPSPLRATKTFPRAEFQDLSATGTRSKRATSLQNGADSGTYTATRSTSTPRSRKNEEPDSFETTPAEETPEPPRASIDLDDLPIELVSLTDSFIDGLSAKVYPTPPNIDNLARMFQDFYAVAASHINTHISSLVYRQSREQSPTPSVSSRASAASILRAKAASISGRDKTSTPPPRAESEQQMITADELADRKRARKALEQKRGLYEEAVERRLCEGIYDRIYRHHSTQDEAQDDKLRSKTAALSVVGIGPADLGVDLGELPSNSPEAAAQKQEDVRRWLDQSRRELVLMNESRYPLGKLNHLKSAHKAIVDTLAHFHPSSSADEIMPMLIYTLITLRPEDLNVISDLKYIQRFRWEPKIEGEASYCLTNLEAAISFLETVDLSTLRADEAPSGPLNPPSSKPGTPRNETFPPAYSPGVTTATLSVTEAGGTTAGGVKPPPSPSGLRSAAVLRNRRLSDLVNTPAQAFSSASGAVMNTFNAADQGLKNTFNAADQSLKNTFSAADQGIKTIGTSLEGSYRLFFGKLAKQQEGEPAGEVILPKTLDDARKLIGTPPPDDDGSASGASSLHGPEEKDSNMRRVVSTEERILTLVGGKKMSRDHSADSSRSGASSRRLALGDEARKDNNSTPISTAASSSNPALIDSVRNLGNSLNPMSRLSGFRGFGRTQSSPSGKDILAKPAAEGGDLATAFPDIAPALPPKPQVAPPLKRFMELQNPADLRIGEVLELLRDYRRLAGTLKDMGAFKE